ncbi:MAG: hypothetical protein IPL39_02985 [Opitutaceae bacterium]|nr:hypothetical protein [Opitutaceae bacterium]
MLKVFGLDNKEVDVAALRRGDFNLIEQGTTAGYVFSERAMVEGVLRLTERSVTEIATRRTASSGPTVPTPSGDQLAQDRHQWAPHFPVHENTRDNVIGMVSVKALWANVAVVAQRHHCNHLTTRRLDADDDQRGEPDLPRKSGKHLALKPTSSAPSRGPVTLIDVMEAIVDDLPEPGDRNAPDAVQREDGSWLVDENMPLVEL